MTTSERRRTFITKFMPILFFRHVSRSGQGNLKNASNFLSRLASVYVSFEVFQTRVAHFCLCLLRIKMPLLISICGI